MQNNLNNRKGFLGEQKLQKWLETQPLLKSLTNVKKLKGGGQRN